MIKSAIKPKTEYALPEKRGAGAPFQRVRVMEHVRRNKWKVQWIEPNRGLIDYVESGQLIVQWNERKAFLKQEENEARLRAHNERHGYDGEESAIVRALYEVFESIADSVDFYRGVLKGSPEGRLGKCHRRRKG